LGLTGSIVQPVKGFDVVSEADFGPVTSAEIGIRLRAQPLEILAEEREHARIASILVEGLQHVAHDHVWPKIGFAFKVRLETAWTKPAIGFLAGEDGIDPLA